MKRLVLELEDNKHQAIKEKAIKEKKSMRLIMTELLDKWLVKGKIKQDVF